MNGSFDVVVVVVVVCLLVPQTHRLNAPSSAGQAEFNAGSEYWQNRQMFNVMRLYRAHVMMCLESKQWLCCTEAVREQLSLAVKSHPRSHHTSDSHPRLCQGLTLK